MKLKDKYRKDTDYNNVTKSDKCNNVYVINNPLNNLYKIGITFDFEQRIQQLECQSGCKLNPLLVLELEIGVCESSQYIEKYLHNYFKDKRFIGEWFSLNKNDLKEIRNLFYQIDGIEITDNL